MDNIKSGFLDIQAVCVEYCISDQKYLDEDSHTILIPENIFYDFINLKSLHEKSSLPLYVGIRNSKILNKRLYFGRIEPSINTGNSTNEMAILPKWVIDELELDGITDVIDIVYISNPKIVDYIKVKANISDYVNFPDIKTILEEKLNQYNCININTFFIVGHVRFKIIELKDQNGDDINFGSIFDREIKIDFDVPEDYLEDIPIPIKAAEEKVKVLEKKESEYKVFQNEGIKLGESNSSRPLTREEIIRERLKRFTENK